MCWFGLAAKICETTQELRPCFPLVTIIHAIARACSSSAPEPNVCPFQWPTNAPATVACASSSSTPTSYLAVSTETDSLSMREFSQSGCVIVIV